MITKRKQTKGVIILFENIICTTRMTIRDAFDTSYRNALVSAPSESNSTEAEVIPPAASLADAKNSILTEIADGMMQLQRDGCWLVQVHLLIGNLQRQKAKWCFDF